MKLRYRENLKPILDLYLGSKNQSLLEDSWGKALSKKKGFPARRLLIGDLINDLNDIPETYREYLFRVGHVYLIPLDDGYGGFIGFGLKAVEEKSFRIIVGSNVIFYGLNYLKSFKYETPVVITEGIKEVEAFREIVEYPYVLGLMTAEPSKLQWEVLSRLTNRILYVGDKDLAGIRAVRRLKFKKVDTFLPPTKDLGVYWEKEAPELVDFMKAIGRIL